MRRYYALDRMAKAAEQAAELEKAAANAIHDGNMVLGLVALRWGDVGKAGMLAPGSGPDARLSAVG